MQSFGIGVEILPHPSEKRSAEGVITAFAPSFTRETPSADRPIIRFVGTAKSEDRHGSVIEPSGARLQHYLANPVFMFAHIYNEFPLGRTVALDVTRDRIVFDVEFALKYEKARIAWELYRDDFLRGVSIGMLPDKWEEYEATTIPINYAENRRHVEWELLELSCAPVPSNREALKLAASTGRVSPNALRALGLDRLLAAGDSALILLATSAIEKRDADAPPAAPEIEPAAPPASTDEVPAAETREEAPAAPAQDDAQAGAGASDDAGNTNGAPTERSEEPAAIPAESGDTCAACGNATERVTADEEPAECDNPNCEDPDCATHAGDEAERVVTDEDLAALATTLRSMITGEHGATTTEQETESERSADTDTTAPTSYVRHLFAQFIA
jgi:hypothetical protein